MLMVAAKLMMRNSNMLLLLGSMMAKSKNNIEMRAAQMPMASPKPAPILSQCPKSWSDCENHVGVPDQHGVVVPLGVSGLVGVYAE